MPHLQRTYHLLPDVALAIDDGSLHSNMQPTRVKIQENHCHIVRPGVLDRDQLQRLTQYRILLVCTGNTCPLSNG